MATTAVAEALRALREERGALRARHEAGMGGPALVRSLSDAMDTAIRGIWAEASAGRKGIALVALGGYGRGELSPHSDVDLMVLHDGARDVAPVSERLFYALWDEGFKVGHATRSVKHCLKLAREELEAETSFLRTRLVAGDARAYEDFAAGAIRQTRKRADRFFADVREMMRARHLAHGTATSQLEPNLKEGTGGLRDLHVLEWFDAVLEGGLGALVGPLDRAALEAAAELLHRVRNHLHYLTDHPTDTLGFQHQIPTARFLRYADADEPAEDRFMRELFAATRSVEHVVSTVTGELCARGSRARRTAADGPFAVEAGRVVLTGELDLAREPERAIELFCLGAPPGVEALRWLERALDGSVALPWTDGVRRAFVRLLRTGDAHAMEAADHARVIERLFPEWDRVRCRPQHNVYHRCTVDAHLYNTVAQIVALGHETDDPLVRDVWGDLRDPEALLWAGLLHDVGKGTPGDHAVEGERIARDLLDRIGARDDRGDTVAWLVRHHLLLVEAATRRDLNEENFIVDVATRIGDAERAKALYLLSVADGRATGPTAWSAWKAALVAELFTKVIHLIERGELITPDALGLAQLRTGELREALTRYPPVQAEAHITGMPRSYLLQFPTTALIRHFALMADPIHDGDARFHVSRTDEPGVYEYTLVARDRPGLFSKVSGVLALNGVSIVTAQGFTRRDGVAIEVFRCVGALEAAVDEERWQRITDDVRRALRGRLSLQLRLAEKRKAYAGRVRRGKREAPRVIADVAASDFATVVEVHCGDRVGLLYDITSTLADLGCDISVAKIATYGEDVVDVFYVRDLDGQKITDAEHLAEIEHALLLRIQT